MKCLCGTPTIDKQQACFWEGFEYRYLGDIPYAGTCTTSSRYIHPGLVNRTKGAALLPTLSHMVWNHSCNARCLIEGPVLIPD